MVNRINFLEEQTSGEIPATSDTTSAILKKQAEISDIPEQQSEEKVETPMESTQPDVTSKFNQIK